MVNWISDGIWHASIAGKGIASIQDEGYRYRIIGPDHKTVRTSYFFDEAVDVAFAMLAD